MRCDFLPASVDRDQPGTIKITNDSEVGVRLPNVSGAEPSSTLFKGNVRPVQKECLLIYNKRVFFSYKYDFGFYDYYVFDITSPTDW